MLTYKPIMHVLINLFITKNIHLKIESLFILPLSEVFTCIQIIVDFRNELHSTKTYLISLGDFILTHIKNNSNLVVTGKL